jgi:hypothetical protein
VRHRLLHDVRRLDTAIIHVNPCGHSGEDAHALTRHHDLTAGQASIPDIDRRPAERDPGPIPAT